MISMAWVVIGAVLLGLGTACEPDCERFDVITATARPRPESAPGVERVVTSSNGGLTVRSSELDENLFEPLRDHFFTGTSSVVGMVRWTMVTFGPQTDLLYFEHRLPLATGDVVEFSTLVEDIEFTGGRDSRTWWEASWRWTEGSTTAARAMLTDGFSDTLSSRSVEGSFEVQDTSPLEIRVGLTFTDTEDVRTSFWSEVRFEDGRGIEACP